MFIRKSLVSIASAIVVLSVIGSARSNDALSALKANLKEYDVPTPNSRPHDPAAGRMVRCGGQNN